MKRLVGLLGLCVLAGCQHTHLRHNTVRQADTLNEIYEQQVLDNLAMFSMNPNALPSFAYPQDGSANITDKGGLSGASPLKSLRKLSFSLERSGLEQWGLIPVSDPARLERMMHAYQAAVSSGWVRTSDSQADLPDCCTLVGEHCGCYAWVEACNQHHLTRLTLDILGHATTDPPTKGEKTVELKVDQYGQLTSEDDKVVGIVKATLDIDELITAAIAKDPAADAVSTAQQQDVLNRLSDIEKQLALLKADELKGVTPFRGRIGAIVGQARLLDSDRMLSPDVQSFADGLADGDGKRALLNALDSFKEEAALLQERNALQQRLETLKVAPTDVSARPRRGRSRSQNSGGVYRLQRELNSLQP